MKKNNRIAIIFIIIFLVLFLAAAFFILTEKNRNTSEIIYPLNKNNEEKVEVENNSSGNNQRKEIVLPAKISMEVPFTSQAPFANWDEFHEEACEEAAIIMVKYFLDGKTISKEKAEEEIMGVIDFQIKKYGDYVDSSAQQMIQIAEDYYGINNMKVVYDFQKEDIKKYLAKGKPIIIPAAGRLLGNPNFKSPGPLFHALVLTGYNGDWIITNDPGTRKGEDYRYKIDVLYNAIHDFTGDKNNIEQGRKAMIVLE